MLFGTHNELYSISSSYIDNLQNGQTTTKPGDYYLSNYTTIAQYNKQIIYNITNFTIFSSIILTNYIMMNNLTQSETWYWRIQASTFITRLNERTVS